MAASVDLEAATRPDVPAAAPARARTTSPGALLLGWMLITWAIAHVGGYYSGLSIVLLLAGCVAVVAGVAVPDRLPARLLPVAVAATGAYLALTPALDTPTPRRHAHGAGLVLATVLLDVAVLGLGALLLLALRDRAPGRGRWAVAASAVLAGLAIISAAPNPGIDVFTILQDSSSGIVHGLDMYRQDWPGSTGLLDIYPYLPGSTLTDLPSWLLFRDVRYADVAALAVAAGCLVSLARGPVRPGAPALLRRAAPLVALLVLAAPRMTLEVQNAWTEPVLLALLLGCVLAVRGGRLRLAVVLLAVAVASKQHMVFLLPLAAWWPAFGWRRAAASTGLAGLIVLPWFLASPSAFWHDAVQATLAFPVLTTAMDVPAVLAQHGIVAGFGLMAGCVAGAYALALWRLPRTAEGFVAGSALVLLAVDLANKETFFNHWSLVTGLLAGAVVLHSRAEA